MPALEINLWSRTTKSPYRRGDSLATPWWDDWVAYSAETGIVLSGRNQYGNGFEAKTGKTLWEHKIVGDAPILVRGKNFINQGYNVSGQYSGGGVVFDIFTGNKLNKKPVNHRTACNFAVGSTHLMFNRDRSSSYAESTPWKNTVCAISAPAASTALFPPTDCSMLPTARWDVSATMRSRQVLP